jgi:PadR family transcriptional regulator, regulatory protein PadR
MAVMPMTGQAFFVLTALADGPRHGYGIVGEVAELSQPDEPAQPHPMAA